MKKLSSEWLICSVFFIVFLAQVANAQVIEVYPTGDASTDVTMVQAAVDAGGTVLLKATNASGVLAEFDFGVYGQVWPSVDVEIVGEWAGSHQTTIRGGYFPILVWAPIKISICGIHFEEPRMAAVFVAAADNIEIAENTMTNIIGAPYYGTYKGQGIWTLSIPPFGCSGTMIISGNRIENVNAPLGYGIVLIGVRAETLIEQNTIRGVNSNCIFALDTADTVRISDNLIDPGPERYPGPYSAGNGIVAGTSLDLGDEYKGNFIIERNIINCENQWALGIFLDGDVSGSKIIRNRITMNGGLFGGIVVCDGVSDSFIGQNHVNGTSAFALSVYESFFPPDKITDSNTFQGNNIAHFEASVADVYLSEDSQNTVVAGYSGTVIDLGVDNLVTGFTYLRGGIGQQIREAHANKRAQMEEIADMLKNYLTSLEGLLPQRPFR